MTKKIIIILYIAIIYLTSGCQYLSEAKKEAVYPVDPKERRKNRAGKLTGEGGLLSFSLGKSSQNEDSSSGSVQTGIGINSYLWRSALDTLSFMPLASADPFGGVIITDYYEDPKAKGEKFKINVLISSKKLKSDAVKVTVFKKIYSKGKWHDAAVSNNLATDLENNILAHARELRIKTEKN